MNDNETQSRHRHTLNDASKKLPRWIKAYKYELAALFIIICILIQTVCLIRSNPIIKEAFREFFYGKEQNETDYSDVITDVTDFTSVWIPPSHQADASIWQIVRFD